MKSGRKKVLFGISGAAVVASLIAAGIANVTGIGGVPATPPDQQIPLLDGSTVLNIVKIPNVPENIKFLDNLHSIDSTVVTAHPNLGVILSQADQRSQLAVEANKGIPAGAGIPPLMKANYVFRLQPTLAADLVKDQSLGFKELPSPTNYDKKIYGTQILIGNSIYSITVFGL